MSMRLLLAKDHLLSALDHEGSDQPAQRPKMIHRKSNQPKKNETATLRSPCAGPAQGPAQGAGVLRTLDPGPCGAS
eukprot:scaffold2678_cov140-Isochrysis_galbana.AAC.1